MGMCPCASCSPEPNARIPAFPPNSSLCVMQVGAHGSTRWLSGLVGETFLFYGMLVFLVGPFCKMCHAISGEAACASSCELA